MQDAKTKGKKPSERDVARQEFEAAKAELLKAQGEKIKLLELVPSQGQNSENSTVQKELALELIFNTFT